VNIDEIIQALDALPEKDRLALEKEAFAATDDMRWVPNPGPQTQAYYCEADELFYGGQAGGGKSDLSIGLALTAHERSLILREWLHELGGRLRARLPSGLAALGILIALAVIFIGPLTLLEAASSAVGIGRRAQRPKGVEGEAA